eukprot:scaffold114801_cov37-Prasinocladus_malaysianus.AAC.1
MYDDIRPVLQSQMSALISFEICFPDEFKILSGVGELLPGENPQNCHGVFRQLDGRRLGLRDERPPANLTRPASRVASHGSLAQAYRSRGVAVL